jgi:Xaa-Pro aminopeptidase
VKNREYSARRRLLAADLAGQELGGMLVSSTANIRYLSGFTGSNALLLVLDGQTVLLTDPRYRIQAAEETDCKVGVAEGPLVGALAKVIRRRKLRLGFEKTRITFEAWQALKESLPPGISLAPVAGLVEDRRLVKSEEEVERMRRSAITNSRALAQTVHRIRPGIRESDLAAELEYRMRRLGAQKPAFDTIIASGARSALPHAHPTSKTLSNNELVLIDMGASLDGYASDMTRMVFLGRPGPKIRRLYDAVLEAQLAALAAVREGVMAEAVDRAARKVLRTAGLEKAVVHSTGHGLGLEIHEPPRLGRRERTLLRAGMAITVEPGVYLQGFGGIRIEDTVVVTGNGCEVLTPTSKELIVL